MEARVNSQGLTEKTCEACGQTFGCGSVAGSCWCMSVSLNAQAREFLKQRYSDCLCEACLQKILRDV